MQEVMTGDARPYGRREQTVPGLVQRLARQNAVVVTAALTEAGMADLTPRQALVLAGLWRGEHASALASRLGVARQTVGQSVAALEAAGYAARSDDREDRRVKLIRLTDRGRRAVRVVHAAALAEERRWGEALGGDRLEELRSMLAGLLSDEPGPA